MAGVMYLGNQMVSPVIVQGGSQTPMFSPYRLENGVLSRITSFQGNEFDGIEEMSTYIDQNHNEVGAFAFSFYFWTISGNLVFKDLKEVPQGGFFHSFVFTNIQTASFPKVESVGVDSFNCAFEMCYNLKDIYFDSLKTTGFKSTFAFRLMLLDCYDVTIHFPSNLENVVSQLLDYPDFGGDDTVLAFDLDPTE